MKNRRWMISMAVGLFICRGCALAETGSVDEPRMGRAAYGRVIDQEERPVAGVLVRLRPAREEEPSRPVPDSDLLVATTDEHGRFELARVPASCFDIVARRQGFSTAVARAVSVPAGQGPVDLGTLVLEPGATIRGRVRDAEGRFLRDVSVWLSGDLRRPASHLASRRPETAPSAVTDAAGLFAVEDLRPGARFHLLLRGAGHLPATLEAVTAPTREPLMVTLEPSFQVRGRVVDTAHDGVAEAEVTLDPPAPELGQMEMPVLGAEHSKRVFTDADGSFVVVEVAAGRFEVGASSEGFVPAAPLSIEVGRGKDVADVTFVLERGASLSGRLTTVDGDPVADAHVRVEGGRGVADSHGSYRIAGVPPGTRVVEARHAVYRLVTREIEIEDGENTLDLVFEPGREVSGRVVDDAGVAVGGAAVELRLDDPEDPHLLRTVTGDAGGFFFPEVAAGSYRLSAEKHGHSRTERPADVEVADRMVADLEVVLPVGAILSGRVFGLDADQLASVAVTAERAGQPPRHGAVDYQGRYRVTDLGAGDYLVRASTDGGSRQAEARVIVEPGVRETRRDLELGQGLTLTGRILFGDEALAGAGVTIRGHDVATDRQVLADHEGAFRVEDLAPGRYRVSVSHFRQLVVHHEDIALDSDRELLIVIGAGRVFGHVTSTAGELLAGATVLMMQWLGPDKEGSLYSTATNDEGLFAVPRITAGRYRVTVRRPGYGTTEEWIDVDGGADLGPLSFALAPTQGLDLDVRLASGPRPPYVTVSVAGADGRPLLADSRAAGAEGLTRLAMVPAGRWRAVVGAPGAAAVEVMAEVPGDPVPVVLPDASRLRVRIPDLAESNRIATLRLRDAQGRPFLGLDAAGRPVTEWLVVGGAAEVAGVPAGSWILEAATGDGRVWEGTIVTAAQPEVAVSLR